MEPQVIEPFLAELKHEISRKAVNIPFDCSQAIALKKSENQAPLAKCRSTDDGASHPHDVERHIRRLKMTPTGSAEAEGSQAIRQVCLFFLRSCHLARSSRLLR